MDNAAQSPSPSRALGLVVVQVDGMSRPVLETLLGEGHMPVLGGLLRSGRLVLDGWTPLLPPCTPASQAGILHGTNDGIPGFRWFEKASRRLLVANHARDAAEIERRMSRGTGLLANDGASIGNLLVGEAVFSHLSMATIEGGGSPRRLRDRVRYTLDPRWYLRIAWESVAELVAEIRQARRQRIDDVRPRMPRGWRYALERVVTNVPLRILSADLVRREILAGRSIVYVDFTGYDEIAHHCGPGRPEGVGAAAKIDRSLGDILDAMDRAPRPYELVVLSDHGQSLGATFRQRYGTTLQELIATLIDGEATYHAPVHDSEHDDGLVRLVGHALGGHAASALSGLLMRRPGTSHHRASRVADGRGAPLASPADAQVADVVVCASGNLGLVYLTAFEGRASKERIDRRYPGLIDALVGHPGIDVVVVHSERGPLAIGDHGTRCLDTGDTDGTDPLASHGPHAADGLRRLAGFDHSGDLIVIGSAVPATGEVVSFEELVGSHGGLGGPQEAPFLAHPAAWRLDEPLVGAPEIHGQLRRWMGRERSEDPAGRPAAPSRP